MQRFYLGLLIILWRIASGSGVFTSSFGIKRSEYCITDGRGVAGPGQGGSAFETVLDQHCLEMSTKSWQKPKRPSKSQDGKDIPVNEMDDLYAMLTTTAKENSALKDADAIARNGTQTAATADVQHATSARRDYAPLLRAPARQGCCRSSDGTQRKVSTHGRDQTEGDKGYA